MEEEEEKKCDEPYDPYVTNSLSRSVSVPNLQSYDGLSTNSARMLEVVQMDGLNSLHLVKSWRHHDVDSRGVHGKSHRAADDVESVGGGVSESKFPDTPERRPQPPMPLFREERILRKDLQSVITMSASTDETVENTSDGSDQYSQQIPQHARQVRLQRLQDARLRAKHISQTDAPLSRLRNPDDSYSMVVPAFSVTADASVSSSTQTRPRTNSLESHHLSQFRNQDNDRTHVRKADPEGIQLTPSYDGSI